MSIFGFIDADTSVAFFHLATVIVKGQFVSMVVESDINTRVGILHGALEEERCNSLARYDLVGLISHLLRTPLQIVFSGIEMLETDPETKPTCVETIAIMKDATMSMQKTLHDVLGLTELNANAKSLELASFSIQNSISFATSQYTRQIALSGIKVETLHPPGAPVFLVGNESQFKEALSILIRNAIKFSANQGTIKIGVSYAPFSDKGGQEMFNVVTTVMDEGIGISDEKIRGLLGGAFALKRPSALQPGQGLGLGLAYCKAIVELQGGQLWATSAPGLGSAFMISLPFAACTHDLTGSEQPGACASFEVTKFTKSPKSSPFSAPKDDAVSAKLEPTANLEPSPHTVAPNVEEMSPVSKLRVLVVDDSPTYRKIMIMLLQRENVCVDIAEDGQDCLNKILGRSIAYDVILMDNLMPVMDGLTATRRLREDGYCHLIVAVTGNVLEEDADKYFHAGANAVYFKPVKKDQISQILEHIRNSGPLSNKEKHRLIHGTNSLVWEAVD